MVIRIPFNSTTPSPFYFPFVHLLPVCSFKNRANRPPASRLKRPSVHFRLEFERISGLGTRLGDFSSPGKKGAIELYLDACRSIDFFLRGGRGGGESLSRTTFLPGFVHRSLFDRPLQFRLRPSFLFSVSPCESLPFLRLF